MENKSLMLFSEALSETTVYYLKNLASIIDCYLVLFLSVCIDIGTGGHWEHVPPKFCNKQRSAHFIFRKCPLFHKEKLPSKCRAPQV